MKKVRLPSDHPQYRSSDNLNRSRVLYDSGVGALCGAFARLIGKERIFVQAFIWFTDRANKNKKSSSLAGPINDSVVCMEFVVSTIALSRKDSSRGLPVVGHSVKRKLNPCDDADIFTLVKKTNPVIRDTNAALIGAEIDNAVIGSTNAILVFKTKLEPLAPVHNFALTSLF